jgi:hypothetical protein
MLVGFPADAKELNGALTIAARLQCADGFAPGGTPLSDAVFGHVADLTFGVTLVSEEGGGEAAVYRLTPVPPTHIHVVELVYADHSVQPGVHLEEGGFFEASHVPVAARVKSRARTIAFARLCAQPAAVSFRTMVDKTEETLCSLAASWYAGAEDCFAAILTAAKGSGHGGVCEHMKAARERLYARGLHSSLTTNVLVEAALQAGGACAVCEIARGTITRHLDILEGMVTDVRASVFSLHGAFFLKHKVVDGGAPPADSALRFALAQFQALTTASYEKTVEATRPPTVISSEGMCMGLEDMATDVQVQSIMRMCGRVCRVSRVRDAVKKTKNTVQGHWNDACVTAAACDAAEECLLSRFIVVVPGLDTGPTVAVAVAMDALLKASLTLGGEWKRRRRDVCADVNVEMSAVCEPLVKNIAQCVETVVEKMRAVTQVAAALVSSVNDHAAFEGAMLRTLCVDQEIRRADVKHADMVSRCPLGNEEHIVYDGGVDKVAATAHGLFGRAGGRVYCIHPQCVKTRLTTSDDDVLGALHAAVQRGAATDPVQDFLQARGCYVCHNTQSFDVSGDGRSVLCSVCSTVMHCPPVVQEKHGWVHCPAPLAGMETSLETGTISCRGCGAVVCDSLRLDHEEDERTYAEEEGETASRCSRASNPFLSHHSDVTYLSAHTSNGVATDKGVMKHLMRCKKQMDAFVPRENGMRLTTWRKKDGHVALFQRVLHQAMQVQDVSVTHKAADEATRRFRDLRWFQEKVCGIRLVMFALIVNAMCECRVAREAFRQTLSTDETTCPRCLQTYTVFTASKHLHGACTAVPSTLPPRKKARTLDLLFE